MRASSLAPKSSDRISETRRAFPIRERPFLFVLWAEVAELWYQQNTILGLDEVPDNWSYRAAQEAEALAEADESAKAEGKAVQPQSPKTQGQSAEADESGATAPKVVHTAENPADAATPNQRYYEVGLPNSPVKLVGRHHLDASERRRHHRQPPRERRPAGLRQGSIDIAIMRTGK